MDTGTPGTFSGHALQRKSLAIEAICYTLLSMRVRSELWVLLAGRIVNATTMQAAPLLPGGGPVAPDTFSIGYSGTQEAYTTSPFPTFATTGSSITGEDLMQVVSDPANVFCAGCLDFILQVNSDNTSSANITSLALSGYAGYQTDAGYDSLSVGGDTECGPADNGYCNISGNGTPATVSRSVSGDVITFNLGSGLAPADASVDYVIETNATSFLSTNDLSVFGGDRSSALNLGGVFSPTPASTATPEPSTILCLGTGMSVLVWRLRKNNPALQLIKREEIGNGR